MNKSALGLVETYGYVGAVEALDVCLKSANVEAVGCEFVKGGIVTIQVTGDVAAVKASVEAAESAVNRITLITTHVIARASDDVWSMLEKNIDEEKISVDLEKAKNTELLNKDQSEKEKDITVSKKEKSIDEDEHEELTKAKIVEAEEHLQQEQEKVAPIEVKTRAELESMKVQELRSLARLMKLTTLTKKQIKFGKKEQLINAITKFYDRR